MKKFTMKKKALIVALLAVIGYLAAWGLNPYSFEKLVKADLDSITGGSFGVSTYKIEDSRPVEHFYSLILQKDEIKPILELLDSTNYRRFLCNLLPGNQYGSFSDLDDRYDGRSISLSFGGVENRIVTFTRGMIWVDLSGSGHTNGRSIGLTAFYPVDDSLFDRLSEYISANGEYHLIQ